MSRDFLTLLHVCFTSAEQECEMFEIKLLVKTMDSEQQKMSYALDKFNLQQSRDFREKVCEKLHASSFLGQFKIRRLVIVRIEEGVAWKEGSFPVVVIKAFGNVIENRQ